MHYHAFQRLQVHHSLAILRYSLYKYRVFLQLGRNITHFPTIYNYHSEFTDNNMSRELFLLNADPYRQ